ncbi:MAG TPA: hypothetical protein VFK05_28270 [Polyangiaceae bacterium]|nr:hypothetical protein [Polyangiaceae bacterium]
MSRQLPAEDLLVLARKRQLSEEEERRLAIARQSSRELECLYRAGLAFDAEAGLQAGDEARVSRLVERTLQRIEQSDPRAPPAAHGALPKASRPSGAALVARYFAVSLGVGIFLCVTLASAWEFVEKRAARQRAEQQAQQAQMARTAARHRLQKPAAPNAAPPPLPPAAPAATQSAPTGASGDPAHPAPVPVGPARKPTVDEPLTSSELFARANQARRDGDIEQAITLYERLEQTYPNSVEAEDAKILRGNLLLMQRSPRAALREFEGYRLGALSLEAVWGRAQALRKLESPEERAVLLELVRDYPHSPYAEAAKKRLRELAR